jgi:osmotically-inducible protein OsmY
VTLSGEVPTYGDLTAAGNAAWRMEGVMDVIDNLTVTYSAPPALPSDADVQARANNILSWEPILDETEVSVTVANGIVTLEGSVDAYWKKAFAENRIGGIRGIVRIDNKLAVVPSKSVTDEAVAADLVAALDRDVLVDSEKITVAVNDGTVTLSGKVPDWSSRRSAEDDAMYTSGVIGIRNQLEIAA